MASTIAWLDASTDEQRRMRDIIKLFADRDSRDDLGLGQVRDSLGDALFPGSSTLHTRARYLLFVPWIYTQAAGKGKNLAWTNNVERNLIGRLRDSDDFAGLLGLRAGKQVLTLPSTIYWAALGTYGIRTDTGATREQTLERHDVFHHEEGDFLTATTWSATLPTPPTGFPYEVPNGFALRREEAEWLRERMLTATHGTLYAHLLEHPPEPTSDVPWLDPSALAATGMARQRLTDAHRFSTVMHGAQLLYNLLLAEAQFENGYVDDDERVDDYRQRLADWVPRFQAAPSLHTDAFDEMIVRLKTRRGSRIHSHSKRFLLDWYQYIREHPVEGLADDSVARRKIKQREKQHKGALARLRNPKRLKAWGGSSGAGELVFRWNYVKRIIGDISDGLAREPEATNA